MPVLKLLVLIALTVDDLPNWHCLRPYLERFCAFFLELNLHLP